MSLRKKIKNASSSNEALEAIIDSFEELEERISKLEKDTSEKKQKWSLFSDE